MRIKKSTLILRSPLTGQWYITKAWRIRKTPDGKPFIEVTGQKEKVTQQIEDIIKSGGDYVPKLEEPCAS